MAKEGETLQDTMLDWMIETGRNYGLKKIDVDAKWEYEEDRNRGTSLGKIRTRDSDT